MTATCYAIVTLKDLAKQMLVPCEHPNQTVLISLTVSDVKEEYQRKLLKIENHLFAIKKQIEN